VVQTKEREAESVYICIFAVLKIAFYVDAINLIMYV